MIINLNIKKIKYIKFIIVAIIFLTYSLINYILGYKKQLYHRDEKFTYIDAMYYTLITITSIGYGDITPMSQVSKFVCIIQIICFWASIYFLFN